MKTLSFHVRDLVTKYQEFLELTLTRAQKGLDKYIRTAEVACPGLALAGCVKNNSGRKILLFGRTEMSYLRSLDSKLCRQRLEQLLTTKTPAIVLAESARPTVELMQQAKELHIPILRSKKKMMTLLTRVSLVLAEELFPVLSLHGTLVEVFGIGVLIQGDSSVGKSEAALGLVERGHRLISDDVIHVQKKEGQQLEGTGPELTRHLLEIRGIGILNIAHLYGAVSVRQNVGIDMIIQLEEWDDDHFYDRVGLEECFVELLDIQIPSYLLPVKPGRDVVLLIETTVLNHRLKGMGYHSAREFNLKLLQEIAKRQKQRKVCIGK